MTGTHDPEALWAARIAIRQAYVSIQRLRQGDPTIRVMATRLDELCVELTVEIESIDPEMNLRSVRVVERVA